MKLYFAPNSRANRPRWMLEELGLPYELVHMDVAAGATRTPEYRSIHPHGQIPALVDGDVTLFESTAICMYLADRYPERALAPACGSPSRGAYYQWLVYCPATLEPAIGLLNQHTVNLPPEQRYEPIVEKSRARLTDSLALLERTLAERPFLVDDRFSTADLIVASNLRWASRSNLLHGVPRLSAWLDQMLARPAALRVFAP